MLQSLITYGYLYSKELSADKAPTVLQPLDEVLEIPEAEALWGTKKKDEKEAEKLVHYGRRANRIKIFKFTR